jgi:hypothetical protein
MALIEVVRDDSMMVPGYEDQTFKCSGCDEVERRRAFRVEAPSAAPEETVAGAEQAAAATQGPSASTAAIAAPDASDAAVPQHAAPPSSPASAGAGELDGEEMLRRAIALVRAPARGSQPLRGLTDRHRSPVALASSVSTKKAGISRLIRIRHDPSYEAAYAAKDTKTGLVVLRHQDSARLRSMCERLGWQVLEEGAAVEE